MSGRKIDDLCSDHQLWHIFFLAGIEFALDNSFRKEAFAEKDMDAGFLKAAAHIKERLENKIIKEEAE